MYIDLKNLPPIRGWKCIGYCDPSGVIYWFKGKYAVAATPYWNGDDLPAELQDNDTGETLLDLGQYDLPKDQDQYGEEDYLKDMQKILKDADSYIAIHGGPHVSIGMDPELAKERMDDFNAITDDIEQNPKLAPPMGYLEIIFLNKEAAEQTIRHLERGHENWRGGYVAGGYMIKVQKPNVKGLIDEAIMELEDVTDYNHNQVRRALTALKEARRKL